MKNTINILAAILVVITLTTSSVKANKIKNDTSDFVVNGLILKSKEIKELKCRLELFYENKKVDSVDINMNQAFDIFLKKNVWYTLRVTKEGYLPLMISFNTEVDNITKVKNNTFKFETELIPLEETKQLNQDMLDFPVGIVSLNKKTRKFEARETYTNNYITNLNATPNFIDIAKEYITKADFSRGCC